MLGQIHGWPDDRDLGAAVGEPGRRIGEVEFPWLNGDFGIRGLEVPHQPEQQVRPGADQVAQPDPPVVRRERDEVVDRIVNATQRVAHLRQPGLAKLGQGDLAGAAGEQHDAQLMLELFDRRRQRGLRDEQPLRGAPVVQLLAQHGEVAQLAQRDVTARGRPPSYGSRGSPSSRSAMMLSCTSDVPP